MSYKSKNLQLCDLVENRGNVEITVRVIRLWWRTDDATPKDCRAIEMILLDENNDTIHATIDSKLLRIFKDGSVAEGTAYKFAKLTVARNNYSNKVTSHNFRIYFEAATTITKVEECNIARNKFQFVEFKDIIHHNVDKNQFIDVIAEVENYNSVNVSKNGVTYTTINLLDKNGDSLICSVWGPYCKIIRAICTDYKNKPTRPIIVLQYVKRGIWSGEDCITTNRGCTRFIVNPHLPEAIELQSRLEADRKAGKPTNITEGEYETNDLFARADLKSLNEIINIKKAGNYLSVLTITDLPRNHAWYFNSCNKCRTKSVRGYGGEWLCTNISCSGSEIPMPATTPRFFVTFGVQEGEDNYAEIQLFENHVQKLVKESVAELLELNQQSPTHEPIPTQLLLFLHKQAVVKLNVSREHNLDTNSKRYTVKGISFNPDDIIRWNDMYNIQKGKGKGLVELGNAGKGSVQSSVESTGNGSLVEADSDQSQHKQDKVNSSIQSSDGVKNTADCSVSCISTEADTHQSQTRDKKEYMTKISDKVVNNMQSNVECVGEDHGADMEPRPSRPLAKDKEDGKEDTMNTSSTIVKDINHSEADITENGTNDKPEHHQIQSSKKRRTPTLTPSERKVLRTKLLMEIKQEKI